MGVAFAGTVSIDINFKLAHTAIQLRFQGPVLVVQRVRHFW